ncbi:hypothetical protein [Pandoraea eparura]|uniref:hypothetical protein n=1 Tax=Pandoraea eparura TaxID=2508291 RepID=UPI00158416C9|nr:hypothetical protein [Pandoraea eparura]
MKIPINIIETQKIHHKIAEFIAISPHNMGSSTTSPATRSAHGIHRIDSHGIE